MNWLDNVLQSLLTQWHSIQLERSFDWVLQSSAMGLILLRICSNNLMEGVEEILIKFIEDRKYDKVGC